jgi:hypothetical protein
VPCDESVDWVPEPTLVELLWFVDVLWSPEPTLLEEFWFPVPMFVLGLTLVFGLTVIEEPPGVVPLTLGVDESLGVVPPTPGSAVCAAAGPMPTTSAASDAAAMDAYPCFIWLTPLEALKLTGWWPVAQPRNRCRRDASARPGGTTAGEKLQRQARGATSSRAITVRWI